MSRISGKGDSMKRISLFLAVLVFACSAGAKEKPAIRVEVVRTDIGESDFVYTSPGTPARATTDCNTNPTVSGGSTTNCTTVSQSGTPPTSVAIPIHEAYVRAIMPDGAHVTLWCQAGFRFCVPLRPGFYHAEVDAKGKTLWLEAYNRLTGKSRKIKYRVLSGW